MHLDATPFSCLVSLLATSLLAAAAFGQCTTAWQPGSGAPGTNGAVRALVPWDPDGPGPMSSVLVLGGEFTLAGGVLANRIATFDPATGLCAPLGSGLNGRVYAVTPMPNGDLVAGGEFTAAGGASASFVARWNGVAWSPIGSGIAMVAPLVQPGVRALAVLPNGHLVAAGYFDTAGGAPAGSIASWDGATWSSLGGGVAPGGQLHSLTVLPNGELVAGGGFVSISGVAANFIASWNGSSWSALGTGMASWGEVKALLALPNGELIAGGSFVGAGGVQALNIARWTGSAWTALGAGMTRPGGSAVLSLARSPNGDIFAGGVFTTAGNGGAASIARWDGTTWSALGAGASSRVLALAMLSNGDLAAGGEFATAGSANAPHAARWNGTAWSALVSAAALDGPVRALATALNGDLLAGGDFSFSGTTRLDHVARWNGSTWSPLGSGINGQVRALCVRPTGDVIAGGTFSSAGGTAVGNVARWDGSTWHAMSAVADVNALLALPNGDVVAGGTGGVWRWDGAGWSPLGPGLGLIVGTPSVNALARMPNGDIVVAGVFTTAGNVVANSIARWDGANWRSLGSGLGFHFSSVATADSLIALANGDVVVGGPFSLAGGVPVTGVARWNGGWTPMATSTFLRPFAFATLPDGSLLAGSFNDVQRWDGTTWSAVGGTVDGAVRALAYVPDGRIAAGGAFTTAGGQVSAYFGTLASSCPATVSSFGAGCSGAGGANALAATDLPWLGATFRAVANGMPVTGIAAAAYGFTALPALPLAALHPAGGAGCTLDVFPDHHVAHAVAGMPLSTQLAIPRTISLIGMAFHEQVVPFEISAANNIVLVTSTNALTATIGVL